MTFLVRGVLTGYLYLSPRSVHLSTSLSVHQCKGHNCDYDCLCLRVILQVDPEISALEIGCLCVIWSTHILVLVVSQESGI